ncbi:MAG TPA: ArsR family transcriptional regulator, partial [Sphingomonadales bacterium]|nr:ArsR family transcriptional regulator [Sphingomonadales bacterium]
VLRQGGVMAIVDFAPHEMEFLREQHAHRRLGFTEKEVSAFAKAAGLKETTVKRLEGGKLTVTIWTFEKKRSEKPARTARLKVVS